jgi:hypothetical protein
MKKLNKILFTVVISVSYLVTFSQTCIIALRTSDAIVIAADSRRTTFNELPNSVGSSSTVLTYQTVCKIEHVGKIYFSQAGMNSDAAYSTVRSCAINYHNLKEISRCFEKKREPEIYNYLRHSQTNQVLFNKIFESLKHFETIIFGIENHIPIVINIDFNLVSQPGERLKLNHTYKIFKPNKLKRTDAISLGEHAIVDSLLHTNIFEIYGAQDALLYIIQKQAEATPEFVAAPFEILSLFLDNTVRWDLDPLNCKGD